MDSDSATVDAAPLGRRERSKAALRQRLLEAALAAFAEKGYRASTIDEIAERADVARATAFNHYPRKEDFLLELILKRRQSIREGLEQQLQAGERSVLDVIQGVARAAAHSYEADRETNQAMMRAVLHSGVMATAGSHSTGLLFGQAIAVGQERGEIRTDLDAFAIGNLLFDSYVGILYRWGLDEVEVSLEEAFGTVHDVVVTGISPR
ncbi:TetR/AcrR family transcriptional regulator [Kribbella sp. NPDC051587]|uniref:TetR/AcrR family transcriptional regulator n=1 Tax=Kribbella sp. NPDC051587 TaxID=3364119 RepID=UPI00378BD885